MSSDGALPSRKLRSRAAAAYLGLSEDYMRKRRVNGDGCPYAKFGRIVVYDVEDLDRWFQLHLKASTRDGSA